MKNSIKFPLCVISMIASNAAVGGLIGAAFDYISPAKSPTQLKLSTCLGGTGIFNGLKYNAISYCVSAGSYVFGSDPIDPVGNRDLTIVVNLFFDAITGSYMDYTLGFIMAGMDCMNRVVEGQIYYDPVDQINI